MKRFRINWGGWSQLAIEIRAIEQLLRWNDCWEFYINLSGQDFPLVSQSTVRGFLAQRPEANMLQVEDPYVVGAEPANRAEFQLYVERWRRFYLDVRIPLWLAPRPGPLKVPLLRRSFPAGVKWYRGSNWKTLSRAFCKYIANSQEKLVHRLIRFFRF